MPQVLTATEGADVGVVGRRTVEGGRRRSAAIRRYPAPPVLASSAVPITAVVSARRGSTDPSSSTWVTPHATQRARRGRRVSVVESWSRTRRVRPYLQGRSIAPHPGTGEVISPAVRSASARARSTIPIIGSLSGHTARAWSITRRGGRGQLVLPHRPARQLHCGLHVRAVAQSPRRRRLRPLHSTPTASAR